MAKKVIYEFVLPLILIYTSYQVGQLYEFFSDDVNHKQNWILLLDRSMTVKWNVKFASENINRIIEALAVLYTITDKKFNERKYYYINIWRLYLIYRILDIPYYFINFKTDWYNTIWVVLAVIEYLVLKRKK